MILSEFPGNIEGYLIVIFFIRTNATVIRKSESDIRRTMEDI